MWYIFFNTVIIEHEGTEARRSLKHEGTKAQRFFLNAKAQRHEDSPRSLLGL